MDIQTLIIFALLICLAPVATLAVFGLLMNFLKKTRPARKRIEREITANKMKAGKLHAHKTGEWVQVGAYDICVHKATAQTRERDQKKERIIFIDVEYRNQTSGEELSCRKNQYQAGYFPVG